MFPERNPLNSLAVYVLIIIFTVCVILTTLAYDNFWGTAAKASPNFQPATPRLVNQPQSEHLAPDAPALKTDRGSNAEPVNKFLDSASWQRWLALPAHVQAKVDPRLIAELSGEIIPAHLGGKVDNRRIPPSDQQALEMTRFIVYLQDQTNLSVELSQRVFASSIDKRNAALSILSQAAHASQATLRAELDERQNKNEIAGYQSFFIVNAMAVEGNLDTIIAFANRVEVAHVQANYPLVPLWDASGSLRIQNAEDTTIVRQTGNWNIDLVGADEVWTQYGVRGEGAVVAGFDTGVEYTHPALNDNYRGKLSDNQYDHNYSWFEPDAKLYPDGNLGASLSDRPQDCDYFGTHGTHTMGTMVGNVVSATGRQLDAFGMAPAAKWIAVPGICPNTMPDGLSDDIGGLKAFQWLLCPTDLSGDLSTADCSQAPDVVNNSWGSANPVNDILHPAVEALRASGIVPVFAAGNPSAENGSIGTPGNSPAAITVGATDITDQVASFSGRGPSFYAGEQKPELTAPGVDILSSVGTSQYFEYSGTSMAAPHVAGLVALMVSADLQDGIRDFNVDDLERFMIYTAKDLGTLGPDNDYGYGRIDAHSALTWVTSAGDLRGDILDSATNNPVSDATVIGIDNGLSFRTKSAASGTYSITAPAGNYDIQVHAWGYESARFSGQNVFPGSLSLADFKLAPTAHGALSGVVTTGKDWIESVDGGSSTGLPVAGATISILDAPDIQALTGQDGSYSLTLPVGIHELVVSAANHRSMTTTVNISDAPSILDLTLDGAPKLLVVDADAHGGWFSGWPVYPIFQRSLDASGYPYELWRIQYLDVTDIEIDSRGLAKSGIPSLDTLQMYDVVIWIHSGCGSFFCFAGGTPENIGADELLLTYLNGGGRLILSGQNISAWSSSNSLLLAALGSNHVASNGGTEGSFLAGSSFLSDLSLEITNASLYGHRNGILSLSPDVVTTGRNEGVSIPILEYENGQGAGALAASPCNADYRSIFYPVGFENLGPRAENSGADANQLMARSLEWLAQGKQDYFISLTARQRQRAVEPGDKARYEVAVANTGLQPTFVQILLEGALWSTTVYSGTLEESSSRELPLNISEPIHLLPCTTRSLTVEVDVPEPVKNGIRDIVRVEASSDAPPETPSASKSVAITLTSIAFARWDFQVNVPTPRYRLAVETLPDDVHVYTMGGWNNSTIEPSAANERFNTCTNTWERMSDIPEDLASPASAVLDGQIYLTGGLSFSFSSFTYRPQDDTYIYDPASDSWATGPQLPTPLYGHAMSAAGGKLYIFGGTDDNAVFDTTYELDLSTGAWQEMSPIPGGKREFAVAAELNGLIYLVGGWPNESRVEVFDPAKNVWSKVENLNFGRQSAGLAAGSDGYLYVAGGGFGWDSNSSVERFHPDIGMWELISELESGNRTGSELVYTTGRLFLLGGYSAARTNESLLLNDSFCLSNKRASPPTTQPGGQLDFAVEIVGDTGPVNDVQVVDQLPANTTFAEFTDNAIGATYNPTLNQIEWEGDVPAGSQRLSYGYTVALNDIMWTNGSILTSTIRFEGTPGGSIVPTQRHRVDNAQPTTQRFTRTVASRVFIPDFSSSSLSLSDDTVVAGDQVTVTVHLKSANAAGGPVSFTDNLPPGLSFISGTLQSPLVDDQSFNVEDKNLAWRGTVPSDELAFINDSNVYTWHDSKGENSFDRDDFAAEFDWIEIRESGENIINGDDWYVCDLPIGFEFPFYDVPQSELCVSTNGFISFDNFGYSNYINECPLPSIFANRGTIAGMWNDLVVSDGIYMETRGQAPERYVIVEFVDVRSFYLPADDLSTFEIILYESGEIKIQFLEVNSEMGAGSTTGVSDYGNGLGTTYACNSFGSLISDLAVVFTPPGGGLGNAQADVSFQVQVGEGLDVNSAISNTVQIQDPLGLYTRTVTATLNPVGINATATLLGGNQVNVGDHFDIAFSLSNSGRFPAADASLVMPVLDEISIVDGSLTCSVGTCQIEDNRLIWQGELRSGVEIQITLSAILTSKLKDNTILVSDAVVRDGFGNEIKLRTVILARSSDLSNSITSTGRRYVELGTHAPVEVIVRNTGAIETGARAEIVIPPGLRVVADSLICGTGICSYAEQTVSWQSNVPPRSAIPLRFFVEVPEEANYGQVYQFSIQLSDLNRQEIAEFAADIVVARSAYFPVSFAPQGPIEMYLPLLVNGDTAQ